MNNKVPTLQDVEVTFEKLDLAKHEAALVALKASDAAVINPAAILAQICPIYQAVRKVLEIIISIPFIPAKVVAGIKVFIAAMDSLCPPN